MEGSCCFSFLWMLIQIMNDDTNSLWLFNPTPPLTYPSQIHKGLKAGLIRRKEIVPKPRS